MKFTYAAEYAYETELDNNPNDIALSYWRVDPGLKYGGWTLKGGYELLSGNGRIGFHTPLATFHAHNGETDQFLAVTPPQGLQDVFGKLSYEFKDGGILDDVTAWAMYHDFSSDEGDTDLGEEFSFLIAKRFNDVILGFGGKAWVEFRFATFDAGKNDPQNRRDVDKLWVTLRYNY